VVGTYTLHRLNVKINGLKPFALTLQNQSGTHLLVSFGVPTVKDEKSEKNDKRD
jgi:hypothetical protein